MLTLMMALAIRISKHEDDYDNGLLLILPLLVDVIVTPFCLYMILAAWKC